MAGAGRGGHDDHRSCWKEACLKQEGGEGGGEEGEGGRGREGKKERKR